MTKPRYSGILVDNYDLMLAPFPYSKWMHGVLGDWVSRAIPENGGRILDVAAGRGEATKPILENCETGLVTAVDISRKMCRKLSGNLKDYVQEGRLEVVKDDIFKYCERIEPGTFDVVASAWAIHNFSRPEREELLRLLNRALKKDGFFMMMDKVYPSNEQEAQRLQEKALGTYDFLKGMRRYKLYNKITEHEKEDFQRPYIMRADEISWDLEDTGFIKPMMPIRCERDVLLSTRKAN